MPSSRSSPTSKRRPTSTHKARPVAQEPSHAHWWELLLVLAILALVSGAATWWCAERGYTLYYGDAEAHQAVARRMVDSRTPGWDQIGTVWLPLPHLLTLPLVADDAFYRTGLAGAIPSSCCFVLAGLAFYALLRRTLGSAAAACCGLVAFACNPNLLYLQATPMTEAIFFGAALSLVWAIVWAADSGHPAAILAASLASLAASLTRYEGWFLIPFAALAILITAQRRRWTYAFTFGLLASLGPLLWLAHNWLVYGDALEFYHGPYSAMAIYQRALDKGMPPYPGDHDWAKAAQYYGAAVLATAGWVVAALGACGTLAAFAKRAFVPFFLLALSPLFYVWSVHSSSVPIFLPTLWPHGWYNTRYALSALPLLALGVASLVSLIPARTRPAGAAIAALLSLSWTLQPYPDSWICWKESQVNSEARRAWTRQAAAYLKQNYQPGTGIATMLGDLTGIYREAGIPLREALTDANNPHFSAAIHRPDLMLWEEWAVTMAGDPLDDAIVRAGRTGPHYECVRSIAVPSADEIRIYRRR